MAGHSSNVPFPVVLFPIVLFSIRMNRNRTRRQFLESTGAIFAVAGIAACADTFGRGGGMNHIGLLGDSTLDNGA